MDGRARQQVPLAEIESLVLMKSSSQTIIPIK